VFTFKDSAGVDFSVGDGGMCNVAHAKDDQARWTWSPRLDGDDAVTDLACFDEDSWTWVEITP
jgi:hypothetical protein